ERRQCCALTEDEALEQRVRGEPVGAVDAGRGALAGGVKPRQRRAAVEVGDDAADGVVRGGGDRDRLGPGVVTGALERRDQPGKARAIDWTQIQACNALRHDRAGDDVAWCELGGEAGAVVVDEERSYA